MNAAVTLFIAVGLFLLAIMGSVWVGRQGILYRKRYWQAGSIALVCTFSFLLITSLQYFGVSNPLSVVAFCVSLVFGFVGHKLRYRAEDALIVLVISSTAAFMQGVRKGLRRGLEGFPLRFEDLFAKEAGKEDHSNFLPMLSKAEMLKPDFLIVAPPSQDHANSTEATGVFERVTKRGGIVIVIENAPSDRPEYGGRLVHVYSESEKGADVVARYVAGRCREGDHVVLLNGPEYSENARVRKKVIRSVLGAMPDLTVAVFDLSDWGEQGAYMKAKEYLEKHQSPAYFVCGNDSMAIGAGRAVREAQRRKKISTRVVGYDGLIRVLIAIAEENDPIEATIRIPPSAYGDRAAKIIREEAEEEHRDRRTLTDPIRINGSHLVTEGNAHAVLESVEWGE